jgi:hypothetical protein
MVDDQIGTRVDFRPAARNDQTSFDGSTADFVSSGFCLYAGKGIPPDFTVAA